MAANRRLQAIQDWANKNIFIGSVGSLDRGDYAPPPSSSSALARSDESGEGDSRPHSSSYGSIENDGGVEMVRMSRKIPPKMAPGGSKHLVPISEDADGFESGAEGISADGKSITAFQAAFNVTNAIQGMFIVGLPFSVKVGGWISIAALVLVAYICYRTGIALIACLYDDQGRKVRKSYRDIAESVSPGLGKYVLAAQLTELASTCILYIVLAADLLQGCIPNVDRSAWMMMVTMVLLGTAFLDDIRIVSHLSLANAVSHLVINAIIVLYCLSQISSWSLSSVPIIPHFRLLPTVIGVVVFGYTSHIFLPSLECSMEDPKMFRPMLAQSHVAAALFKAIFGLIGFLTFAQLTQKEISNSLPNQGFKIIVNLVLVVKALLSYPLPYFAIVQLIKENFFRGVNKTMFPTCYSSDGNLREWALCLRILLLLWTLFMALSVPYLVELMGLVGNITGTVLSFIWPAYFHLRLKGAKLSEEEQKFDKIVIASGIATCIIGVYYSGLELILAISENRR